MDLETINECNTLSASGKITFPEVVKKLASCGVERYVVDLVGSQKTSYGVNGEFHLCHLTLNLPKVEREFDVGMVRGAISAIQQNKMDYLNFMQCIAHAGCCHYEVYILGKKVMYFGRDGSYHTELFPTPK